MKRTVKLLITVCVFFLIITSFRIIWIATVSPTLNLGESVPGAMDLSSFDSEEALYPLFGEWIYYPDMLLTLEEIEQGIYSDKSQQEHYPQGWLDQSTTKDYNYGTFHLRLSLHKNLLNKSLSLHVPKPRLASRLYINGELLGSSGHPASHPSEFQASMSPYTVHFYTQQNIVDIVMHVSNNGSNPLTPTTPIIFGTTDAIQGNQVISTISKTTIVIVFSFIILFAFMLFVYYKKEQRKLLLYLALFSLFVILTTLIDYDRVVLLDLPLTYHVKSKVYRLAFVLNALFGFQFFRYMLEEYKTSKLFMYYPFFNLMYGVFIILTPINIVDKYIAVMGVITIVPVVYFTIKLFYAVRNKAEDAELLLLMALCMLNSNIWAVSKHVADFLTFEYYPIDTLIALLLFILYWLRKYSRHVKKIETLTNELIVADKSKDDFLAQTSHELRNPLHSMMNIAQLVVDNPRNSIVKEDKENMHLLLSVGNRMSMLVDDLLDLTLMTEKKLRLDKEKVYIAPVVATAIDMLDYLVSPKNIVIHHRIAHNFPPVYADENRMVQLILNLIHNAIKFTDVGEIVITAYATQGYATIRIQDTGIGIAPEVMKEVFRPFYKDDAVEGIGLGLQISKQLVELHGGEIFISSQLHEGTIVSFSLPFAEDAPELKADLIQEAPTVTERKEPAHQMIGGESASAESQNFRAKILLVDDDQVNLNVIARVLQADDYDIVTALSGHEALQEIQTRPFDLVISDVMMPMMSGYALVGKIRERYDLSELPIILLTARGRTEDLNAGFQAGANDYVIKPVDTRELKARVKALTDLQVAMKEQLLLEAAWLRAQINPHFLYNTINSIMMMTRTDPAKMKYLLEKFVYFLRTSFDFQSQHVLVPLKDELALIDAYLTIEKERFGERVQVIWGIDESLDILIPPLSLQTLVENALNHGILSRAEGGTITLQSIEEERHVDLIIQDDGVGMQKEIIQKVIRRQFTKEEGIGLLNTNKRLRKWLHTSLVIESEINRGTKITIRIKKKQQ